MCVYASFARTAGQIYTILLEVVGEVQGSFSLIPNKCFDLFDATHVKHNKTFVEGKKVAQVAFRNIISTF